MKRDEIQSVNDTDSKRPRLDKPSDGERAQQEEVAVDVMQ